MSTPSDPFSAATILRAMTRMRDAMFCWTPDDDDRLTWARDTQGALPVPGFANVSTGAELRALYAVQDQSERDAWITASSSRRMMQNVFQLRAPDGALAWIEERLVRIDNDDKKRKRYLGILRDVSEAREREERLAYPALFDELTGLLSRGQLRAVLAQRLSAVEDTGKLAYAVVGIDKVSSINMGFGYDVTDEAILATGRRIAGMLDHGDIIGRVAGSKFGVLFEDCDRTGLTERMSRIRTMIRDTVIQTHSGPVPITASVGGVVLPDDARTTHDAFAFAEDALASAKSRGADTQVMHARDAELIAVRRRNISVADDIVAALNEGRFRLAYQPVVRASDTKSISFHECLIRMVNRDGSIAPAGAFMPVAERLGLVRILDREVLKFAVETLMRCPKQRLSFNLSPQSLKDPGWLSQFYDLTRRDPSIAERMIIEVTEATAIHDTSRTVELINGLRQCGCAVALDDFGAGYTSFSQLQNMAFDIVKIDGSYVRGVCNDANKQLFVRSLSTLASNFDMMVVAEMVDSDEAGALLRSLGVDAFQGFHFGVPDISPEWMDETIGTPRYAEIG